LTDKQISVTILAISVFSRIFCEDRVSKRQAQEQAGFASRNSWRKAKKGRPAMQTIQRTASASTPAPGGAQTQFRRTEDRVYQAVTVAAILLLLGSL
jgi:hypothetical protein